MNRSTILYRPLTALSLLTLCSCAVGPDYKLPLLDLPSAWHQTEPAKPKSVPQEKVAAWWEDFNDPAMTALIQRALANNENLAIAASRITEVRGLRESAFGKLFPQIKANAAADRGNPGVITTDHVVSYNQGTFDSNRSAFAFFLAHFNIRTTF